MDNSKKIVVGADHAGFKLKEELAEGLRKRGFTVEDAGTGSTDSCDYPDFAHAVARKVAGGDCARGLLVCGSGIGMCMAANRTPGVRAVNCTEPLTAEMSRKHNDSNVLCIGERIVGVAMAWRIVDTWLDTPFEGGRHQRRVGMIEPA